MGILSKAKSKLKSVVNTAAKKVYNTVNNAVAKVTNTTSAKSSGGGSGGGGGGSWSAPKINNVASVAAANPTSPKTTAVNQLVNTVNQLKNGTQPNQSVVPKNQSTIPSPSAIQPVTDPKTGKTSMVDVTKPKIDVQGAIDKATGGKAGPQSKAPSSTNQSRLPDSPIQTVSSYGTIDTNFGLGDFEEAADTAFTTASSPSSTSSPSSSRSSSSSSSSPSSGGGGSSAPTSQRGANVQSARDQAIASAKAEAERLAKEVGLLSAKDESAAADAVVSDTTETQSETDAFNYLKEQPDNSALKLLDEEIKNLKQNLRENEKTIGKAYDVKQTGIEGQQASETGQASVGIANAGGYLGFSGSGQGVMLSLAESHRAELVSLESERQQALQEARNAAATRRYDIVRLKADEIARIDQEKYERTKEYNAEVKKEADKTKEEAKKTRVQTDIFNAIQGGAKTAKDIFQKLGGKTDISEINDFLEQMSSSVGGKFKFTGDETAGFLGAGMSQDDISALQEYVNENGYNDTIRNSLTPAERAVADKVYGLKTGNNSNTSFRTEEGVDISDTTMQVLDGFTTLKSLTPTAAAKVRSELYALGFGSDTVPDWFDADTVTEMMGVELTQEFLEGFYKLNMEPSVIDAAMNKYTSRFIQDAWKNYRARVYAEKPTGGGSSSGGGGGLSDINEDDL